MPTSSAGRLLDSWDSIRGEAMPVRAAALAAMHCGVPPADAAGWSITRRDLALFDLRADLFGDGLDAVATCASCSTELEMQVALAQIRPQVDEGPADDTFEVIVDGTPIRCRMPNTDDLIAAGALVDIAAARRLLIQRCVADGDEAVRERAVALLPPQSSDVQLHLTCPSCGHGWQTPFDI